MRPAQGSMFLCSLKMTMDKKGLLQLSGPDKVTISLFSLGDPQRGLMLLLSDTQHFSNNIKGDLGMMPLALKKKNKNTPVTGHRLCHSLLPIFLTVLNLPFISGRFYQDIIWDPPIEPDNTKRTVRVQGVDYPATR